VYQPLKKPGEAMAFASHICAQGIPQGRMLANKDVLSIVKIRRAWFLVGKSRCKKIRWEVIWWELCTEVVVSQPSLLF